MPGRLRTVSEETIAAARIAHDAVANVAAVAAAVVPTVDGIPTRLSRLVPSVLDSMQFPAPICFQLQR